MKSQIKIIISLLAINLFCAINCMDDKSKQEHAGVANSKTVQLSDGAVPPSELQDNIAKSGITDVSLLKIIAQYVGSQAWEFKETLYKYDIQQFSYGRLFLSPNSQYLAVFTNEEQIKILDLNSNLTQEINTNASKERRVLSFAHDSKSLAIGFENGLIKIYDMISKQYIDEFISNNGSPINDLQHSSDGKYLAFSDAGGCFRLYDLKANGLKSFNGENIVKIDKDSTDTEASVITIAFSPDNKTIISGDAWGFMRIMDLKDKDYKCKHSIASNPEKLDLGLYCSVSQLKYSPDGQYFLSVIHSHGYARVVLALWNSETYQLLHIFNTERREFTSIMPSCFDFSTDSQYLAIGFNNSFIKIFSLKSKSFISILNNFRPVVSVIYTYDGKFLISGNLDQIKIWENSKIKTSDSINILPKSLSMDWDLNL